MFANRLAKNQKKLSPWLSREKIHCYGLYDADMPEYALAIDLYEGDEHWVHVQEYEALKHIPVENTQQRLNDVIQAIHQVLNVTEQQMF